MNIKLATLTLALATVLTPIFAHAATVRIACSSDSGDLCKKSATEWARKTGNEVEIVTTPNDSSALLALYQQILNSGSDKIDVFEIDMVWPGALASHFIDLRPYTNGVQAQHFASLIANDTVGGRLVAMPWFTDAGLLYYRKDLLDKYKLQPPTTWDELASSARKIQDAERKAGNDKMWGYVWQGRAYEGLSCNALEWVASYNGGTVVDAAGKVTIDNPGAVKALDMAAGWIGTITPQSVLNYGEEEARGVFQAGNSVYMRNWPYAWSLLQKNDSTVRDKVGVMPLPRGGANGRDAGTLGGWQLSVSRYSKNPKLAADLVTYMTSAEVQKMRAIQGSYNPTIPALYKDADIVKANPFMTALYSTFTTTVSRPSTVTSSRYNQVSSQFWNAVHDVLSGDQKAADALGDLQSSLNGLKSGNSWK
ncbi:ABC transporter substrate-binding protein [Paraburkholderia bryophila]|uniref:ABC transporter substrate-binding protein n=1 Tax=Paraburkholderia bryophila TaxID=420952 RepID=UPI002349FAC6|nr:ABC transporter substrate-binding protein [Paraburkholderia bryophila]WCM22589.1 ABC transporter substrate-binding protein [Paraburkholderia bryophila]